MKFLTILLNVCVVTVVTATQDPLQQVLQEVEQLKSKVAYLEQKLEMERKTSGNITLRVLLTYNFTNLQCLMDNLFLK